MEKEKKLLKRQLEKIGLEGFDLEAWKSSTTAVLTRLFGENDSRVKEVSKLKIDYGSWALRDAKASYNPLESCKKIGKEIIESALDEIEIFGIKHNIKSLLIETLDPAAVSEIIKILESSSSIQEKNKKLSIKLNTLEKKKLTSIIADLLLKS